jgi:hypothetical protein
MRGEIDELLKLEPFLPFRITLTSGQAYDVRYPALISVAKDVVHYMHPKSELRSILRLVQVAAVDMIE